MGRGCTGPPLLLSTLGFAGWVLGWWALRQGLLRNYPSRGCCLPRGSLEAKATNLPGMQPLPPWSRLFPGNKLPLGNRQVIPGVSQP